MKFKFPKISPEAILFFILICFFFAETLVHPIVLDKVRTSWLFNAQRLFSNGFMPHFELSDNAGAGGTSYSFSNANYPLLFPGLLSFFSAGFESFNERMAQFGIFIFFSSILLTCWVTLRKTLGRTIGALFCFYLFFANENMALQGCTEGFLMTLLLLTVLWHKENPIHPVCVSGLALIASLKPEGLWLAVLFLVLIRFGSKEYKALSLKEKLFPWVMLLPAKFYRVWADTNINAIETRMMNQEVLRIPLVYTDRLLKMFSEIPHMLADPGPLQTHFILWDGLFGLALFSILLIYFRKRKVSVPGISTLNIMMKHSFVFIALSLIVLAGWVNIDTHVLVNERLENLLLHPALLFAIAPFLL